MLDKWLFQKLSILCFHILVIGLLTTVATTVSLYHYGSSGDNLVNSFITLLQSTFAVLAATIWVVMIIRCITEIIRYIATPRSKDVIYRKVKNYKLTVDKE